MPIAVAAGTLSVPALAAALDVPAQHCQLLTEIMLAVGADPPGEDASDAATSAVPVHQLLLFLFTQLYGKEAQKPEPLTGDHWPDPLPSALDTCFSPTRLGSRSLMPGECQATNCFLLQPVLSNDLCMHCDIKHSHVTWCT